MMSKTKKKAVLAGLAGLFDRMSKAYSGLAKEIGLDCAGCEDNCCTSFFEHHTYVEWAFLWEGLRALDKAKREDFRQRARETMDQYRGIISQGFRPRIMCPLNDDGLCGLYDHRLMICRLHGVPNSILLPSGERKVFAGCFKTQAIAETRELPSLDRTDFYKELTSLEMKFVGPKLKTMPRVRMTFAEMIVSGPPKI